MIASPGSGLHERRRRTRRVAARRWLSLGAVALASALAPASASAHSLHDRARATGQIRDSAAPVLVSEAQLARALQLAPGDGYDTPHGSATVRALQLRLTAVDAAPGPIDGRYGPLTTQAVERFQTAHSLNIDGIAGPITLAVLTGPGPVAYPGAGEQLTAGSPTVRALQRRLAKLGYRPGPIDGRDGPLTTRAVERFQGAHRLARDGVIDARTWDALGTPNQPHNRPISDNAPQPAPKITKPIPEANQPAPKANQPAPKTSKHPPELPITPVLLGLLALGLTIGSVSYTRARRARTQPRARTGLQIRPVRLPPGSRAAIPSMLAERQERQR
jgi:peptidoglycan hydrolase-like protein with peptidoglycan-binding domain